MSRVEHTLNPIYDENSTTLILGSMPSVKSRELNMYYGNKTNRFWKIMSSIYDEEIDDYKKFVLDHHIALWDVIKSCEINGSSDSSIKDVVVNDIKSLIDKTKINRIFLTGKKAFDLYNKYLYNELKIEGICLSSPSAANARMSLNELINEYKKIIIDKHQ